jgi:hypothetical protein
MRHGLIHFRQSFMIASNGSIWTLVEAATPLFTPPTLQAFCFVLMSLPIFLVSCVSSRLAINPRGSDWRRGRACRSFAGYCAHAAGPRGRRTAAEQRDERAPPHVSPPNGAAALKGRLTGRRPNPRSAPSACRQTASAATVAPDSSRSDWC